MLQQFFYRERGLFLQSLHPGVALFYIGTLLVLTLLFAHPLYLMEILLVTVITVQAAGGLAAWEGYMKPALAMVFVIMLLNPFLAQVGTTVIWHAPEPVPGRLTVTLEAVCYGAAMGMRLLDIISIFCLYNLMVNPDRLLGLFSRFASKSVLVVSLATRLFPVMAATMNNIREVQQLRGVDFKSGSVKERFAKYTAMFNILLVSSLENSLELAEAMHARAFGSGSRSSYRRECLRPRDLLCLGGAFFSLGTAVYVQVSGLGAYTYYPQLDPLVNGAAAVLVLLVVLAGLLLPAGLSWGWMHWPYLKSRI